MTEAKSHDYSTVGICVNEDMGYSTTEQYQCWLWGPSSQRPAVAFLAGSQIREQIMWNFLQQLSEDSETVLRLSKIPFATAWHRTWQLQDIKPDIDLFLMQLNEHMPSTLTRSFFEVVAPQLVRFAIISPYIWSLNSHFQGRKKLIVIL